MTPSTTSALQTALEDMLVWLRNGATVVGNDPVTIAFRETCLERAYVIASQDVTPAVLALGRPPGAPPLGEAVDDVYHQHLHNLIDVSAMMQKKTIMAPLRRPLPPLPLLSPSPSPASVPPNSPPGCRA